MGWTRRTSGLAVGLGLALGGCTVGPEYRAPAPLSPKAYSAGAPPSPGPADPEQRIVAAAPPADWWRAFGSPEIDACVAEALAQNPDIATARASLAQAREAALRAGAALHPSLDANVQVSRLTTSFLPQGIDQRGSLTNDYLLGPSVRYAIDAFGGGRRLRAQRDAEAQARAFELEAARLTVSAAVVRAAVEAARLRAQLATLDEVLAGDRQAAASMERLLELRRRTVADLAAARSRLAADEALAPPLRQQLAAATTALALLTGRTPGEAAPSVVRLETLTLPRDLPSALPADMVRRRPDVRAAEAGLRAANAGVGVAEARLYPSLALTGSITQESLSIDRLFNREATGGVLTAGLTAPIFHAGELRSQKREAVAAYDGAAARYRKTVLAAAGQVSDVLQALDNDARAVAAEGAAVDAAERALAAAEAQFAAARVDVLLVLTARQDLGEARMRQAAARAQRLLDTAQLYLALGGGGVS